jgi:hypothetical protein
LSAAADALVSIIADELRQVSSASELDATLNGPPSDASNDQRSSPLSRERSV